MTLENVKIVDPTQGSQFWKPMPGKHTVEFLDNGKVKKDVKLGEGPDDIQDMFYIDIRANGEQFTWSTNYRESCTDASMLGQLKKLETMHGFLKGISVVVMISGQGQNKRYILDLDAAKEVSADPKMAKAKMLAAAKQKEDGEAFA